jgi:steroid delta-isomerase-like uncharacterized protein
MAWSYMALAARAQRAWNEVMAGNLDALDEIFANDVISRGRRADEIRGLATLRNFLADSQRAFSDQSLTWDEVMAEGDRLAIEWTWRARHTGQSSSFPFSATGKPVTLRGCSVVRLAGGKAIEENQYADNLAILQQVGVLPPPG